MQKGLLKHQRVVVAYISRKERKKEGSRNTTIMKKAGDRPSRATCRSLRQLQNDVLARLLTYGTLGT